MGWRSASEKVLLNVDTFNTNPEQYKNNAKRIQETNQETNEIIIYETMKEVYKARKINQIQLRNCISNNVSHNEFKYQVI